MLDPIDLGRQIGKEDRVSIGHSFGDPSQARQVSLGGDPAGQIDSTYLARVAERIHDQPMQLVSAARLCLRQLRQDEAHLGRAFDDADRAQLLERADGLLAHSLAELRRLMSDACPVGLDAPTLEEALAGAVAELDQVYGLRCDWVVTGLGPAVGSRQIDLVVRFIREAALNAYKHGGSKRVRAKCLIDAEQLRLVVANACSPDVAEAWPGGHGGFGLAALSRRAEVLGGGLELRLSDRQEVETECELFFPLAVEMALGEGEGGHGSVNC